MIDIKVLFVIIIAYPARGVVRIKLLSLQMDSLDTASKLNLSIIALSVTRGVMKGELLF